MRAMNEKGASWLHLNLYGTDLTDKEARIVHPLTLSILMPSFEKEALYPELEASVVGGEDILLVNPNATLFSRS